MEVFEGQEHVPESHPTALRVALLLKEFFDVVIARAFSEKRMLSVMSEVELSMPQVVTLCTLHRMGPHSISGIASHLNLSLSATSHLVDRMVERGLVERTEDVEDRRQKRVAATAPGAALAERVAETKTKEFSQALSTISPERVEKLAEALEAVLEQLKSRTAQAPDAPGVE